MNHPRKILIVGPSWVGDMVMAQTLFKLLKQEEPAALIDVLAPEWSGPLLAVMPEVNRALVSPFRHGELQLRKRYRFAKQLREQRYDQAIVLTNSFKSALIPFFAKIPLRTGWCGEMRWGLLNDVRYLDKKKFPLMIQRFMALALPKGTELPARPSLPALQINQVATNETLQRYSLILDHPVLVLCPGAEYGPAKRWPAEYYARIAKTKIEQGWQVWLLGSQKDQVIAQKIQHSTASKCINLTGKTHLSEAMHLLAAANAVVTNDSGLMHVAAALQKPLIVIYGSSSPAFTPPLTERVKILSLNSTCSPCFARECPLQHFKCMNDLKPMQVLQALDELGEL